jgi:ribonuclease HI
MTRLKWNRPRQVFEPWYSRDLFGPKPAPVKVERLPRRKFSQPKPQTGSFLSNAGPVAGGEVLRTRDIEKARLALCLATSATVWCDGAELFDGGAHGTNNAAELQAAIAAFQILPETCAATIFGDSQYLIFGISKWSAAWKRKNWQKAGQPIPNADLWKQLDALASGRSIDWQWVRGHAGNANNELADKLAGFAAETVLE